MTIAEGAVAGKKQRGASEVQVAVKRRRRPQSGPVETVRTFCALPLDPEAVVAVDNAISGPRSRLPDFRWVPPQRWHITLKFYGDTREDVLDELGNALATIAGDEIPIELRAMGAFPHMRSPRVLWVGVRETGALLTGLYRRVNDVSARFGFELEDRRFRPHLTVARVRGGSHPVARELTPLMDTSIGFTTLQELHLYRSDRHPDGPVYSTVRRIRLAHG